MFTYRCPACGKHHTVDREFDQPFEAKCLRCSGVISVTRELVHPSGRVGSPSRSAPVREDSITPSLRDSALRASVKTEAVDPVRSNEPALDAPSLAEEESAPTFALQKNDSSINTQEKTRSKKACKQAEKQQSIIDEDAPEPRRWTPPTPPNEKPKGRIPRRVIIGGGVAVLILVSALGYLMFGGKKTESNRPKTAVAKATTKPSTKPASSSAKKVEKKADPPVIKTPDLPPLVVSAPRLSAELAADADLVNRKYAGKLLEVSGLFSKIEQKEGLRFPARPHACFATSGAPVACDIGDSYSSFPWNRLKPDQPFTIRGQYEKNGYLRGCSLLPEYISSADRLYKGKIIEVSGQVAKIAAQTNQADAQLFPTIVFAGGTDSLLQVRCLFRMTDGLEVSKIQPGTRLTIQGLCSGRQSEREESIRLDNCQLVYTSAPPPGMPRLEALRLLWEYQEDLRPDYLPPPGEEEAIDTVWTIRQLVQEYTANPKTFVKKCHNRILCITSKLRPQGNGSPTVVVLTSGDTDLNFQVECYFSVHELEALRRRREAEVRIRGLFTGKIDEKRMRLDNCQLDMPRNAGLELTADYLPHKAGRTFLVDVATFGPVVNRKGSDFVQREVHVQGKDGLTEVVVTHAGSLAGKSLFAEGVQEAWVKPSKVRVRNAASTGIYFHRLQAGFVELGTPQPGVNGKTDITWLPVLKLEAHVGEKWKWESPSGFREYTLEKFDDYQGQPCAVIRELLTLSTDVLHPIETLHVYAKGLGEVERRQWKHLDQQGRKHLLSEMRWVDAAASGTNATHPGKPASQPADSASAPIPGKTAEPKPRR